MNSFQQPLQGTVVGTDDDFATEYEGPPIPKCSEKPEALDLRDRVGAFRVAEALGMEPQGDVAVRIL